MILHFSDLDFTEYCEFENVRENLIFANINVLANKESLSMEDKSRQKSHF